MGAVLRAYIEEAGVSAALLPEAQLKAERDALGEAIQVSSAIPTTDNASHARPR